MQAIAPFQQPTFMPISDIREMQSTMMNIMPPLKRKQMEFTMSNQPQLGLISNPLLQAQPLQVNVPTQPQNQLNSKEAELERQKLDHKERNRIAAQKWRAKKDESLQTLEEENDVLRKKVYDLQAQALCLSTENKILDSELQYFQHFMSRIMSVAPKK